MFSFIDLSFAKGSLSFPSLCEAALVFMFQLLQTLVPRRAWEWDRVAMTSVLPLLATSVRKDVTADERGRSRVVWSLNMTLRGLETL